MIQILKRLEIIKSSIVIEDEDIIELQLIKLQQLDVEEDVNTILFELKQSNFFKALQMIEEYLSKYSGVTLYEDKELLSLKLELKSLEAKLQNLIEQKTEYLNDVEEFNKEYNLHLGEIIKTVLNLKKEILYNQTIKQQKLKEKYQEDLQTFNDTKETIKELKSAIKELKEALETIDEKHENYDEIFAAYQELLEELKNLEEELIDQEVELENIKEALEDDEISQEYEEAKAHYDEFNNEYEHIKEMHKDTIDLNEEDKAELKKLYRKAARLCHPDTAPDELKEKAQEIMQQLNDAYGKKDLAQVKKILHSLENGLVFETLSSSSNNKELLKKKIKEYKENIANLEKEIIEIQADETFTIISQLEEWNEYFEELKAQLLEEKEQLENEAKRVLDEKEEA